LQEVGDSFGFPIMEEELSKESAEKFWVRRRTLVWSLFLFSCCSTTLSR
jgi:hypothetical protein